MCITEIHFILWLFCFEYTINKILQNSLSHSHVAAVFEGNWCLVSALCLYVADAVTL